MVHDPRVSSCLARLSGVYRDALRVDRDAATLLKSPVGSNLVPIVAQFLESSRSNSNSIFGSNKTNNGTNVLVLQGTIAIHFRGQTYQLLIDQYLPAGYPERPPVPFVRLAPNMYLKENHRHVGSDGKVYLPYLNQWRSNTHNLVELVVAMSSVFSADPPVFTRRPGGTPITTTTTASTPTQAAAAAAAATDFETAAGGMLSDAEAIAAVQAQEERDRVQAEERRLEQERIRQEEERLRLEEERETQRAVAKQEEWERQRTEQARVQVTAKIRQHLQERARETQHKITGDLARDLNKLRVAKEQKIEGPIEAMTKQKTYLEEQLAAAEESKVDIEEWISQVTASKQQQQEQGGNNNKQQRLSIDDKVVPYNPLHAQMMELSAENAAITDALYFLDRAIHQGHISCEVHLKQVRQLAKRQFLVRAHLIKINQVSLSSSS